MGIRAVVSVVIPTRNRLRYLQEAVASVQAQTLTRWELLVVDDASEDKTPGWLESISDPRIRVLRMDQHVHRSPARNRGLAQASGEYVIFLDDDDRFRPRALAVLVHSLKRHHDAVAACGARINFDESGHHRRYPHVWIPRVRVIWPELFAGWVAHTGQVMFPTELLRSIGGWDEALIAMQDWELHLRVSHLGPMYLDPYVVVEARKHPQQWTPHDILKVRSGLDEAFLASLAPTERALGEGALRMRSLYEEALVKLTQHNEPGSALRLFYAAFRSAPTVARTPQFRARFLRGFSQALIGRALGRRASRRLESLRGSVLRVLRKAPGRGFSASVVSDSAIRDDESEDLRLQSRSRSEAGESPDPSGHSNRERRRRRRP
ncbi:MAG: glycosyltransferase family 2 protein [Actinomycetota bacterium]